MLLLGFSGLQAQGKLGSIELGFGNACASTGYNNFQIKFKWTAPMPNPANQYIIELSDANGSFANPLELKTITGQNSSLEISTTVQFPTTLHGLGYRIRVSSTNPSSSVTSDAFSGYYINVNTPMILNGGTSTLAICPGHTQTISVDKQGEVAYRWYKDNVQIPNQTGYSLEVSEAGVYYAMVEYGNCTGSSLSRSNNVTVSMMSALGLTISGTPADGYICSGSSYTMTASVISSSYNYIWYRNGTKIAEGTGMSSYTTPADATAAGTYYAEISSGGACSERSNSIEVRLSDGFTTSIASEGGNIILPGGSKVLTVTSTAPSATYQWFNATTNQAIPGATSASFTATAAGTYYASVTSTGTCAATVQSDNITLVAPDNYNVAIGYKGRYADCTYDRTTLEVKSITAVSGSNTFALDASAFSQFTYTWYNDTAVSTLSAGQEITIADAADNGNYTLQLSATGFSSIPRSTALKVQLLDASYIQLNGGNESLEFCTASTELNASLQDPTATYTWYKDDEEVSSGVGAYTYTADESGRYHVSVAIPGDCPAVSNYVVAVKEQTTAGWVNPSTAKVAFLGYRTYTLNLTHNMTSPTVEWYRNGTLIPNANATSYTITQAGLYNAKLTDTGGCLLEITTTTKRYVAPGSFIATIGYKQNQSACDGTEAVLELQKLQAVLADGSGDIVDIPTDEYQYYNFQWLRNDVEVNGATAQEVTVQNPGNNTSAEYRLQVSYGTIVAQSDPLTVTFVTIPDITVTSAGAPVLCQGGSVVLSSSLTSSSYTYQWYHNHNAISGETNPTLTVAAAGDYYVRATFGGCYKESAAVSVANFSPSVVTLDVDASRVITITGANGVTVTASGADSYLWTAPDGSVLSSSAIAVLRQSGTYTLLARVGTCSTTLTLEANAVIISEVPNVVTPNGDGYNDLWTIPDTYAYKANVKVTIYSQEGKEALSTFNYQNNWPQPADIEFGEKSKRAFIYLYIIEEDGQIKEQGTISIFR